MKKIFQNFFLLLLLIIILGGFLRFYHLNWDQGLAFHPDERNIIFAVEKIQIPQELNPHFFAYGSLPIYFIRITADVLNLFSPHHQLIKSYGDYNLLGRLISAIFSTISIYLIYLLGRKLSSSKVGLLSACLFALSPGLIQYAHYSVTESWLVFFLLLISIYAIKIDESPNLKNWLILAIFCGLAIGTKIVAIIFLIIPLVTWLFSFRKVGKVKNLILSLVFILTMAIVYFISSPYTILDFPNFKNSISYENSVVTGKMIVPYTLQFLGTKPYLFFFQNLGWQTNFILPTLGFLGIIVWLIYIWKTKKEVPVLPFLIFALVYFIAVGWWQAKFIRYMLPFVPFLILAASWLIFQILKRWRILGNGLIVIIIAISFLWSLAYLSVFIHESTRISASKWIYQNVPWERTLLIEHWDDKLPVKLKGENPEKYQYLTMKNYDPETEEKISKMADNLASGDYLILSSRRLSGSIPKDPQDCPITSKYYDKLFAKKLGYQQVFQVTSYPRIWRWQINDDQAEETFQVFDHPKVMIFQNVAKLSPNELLNILKDNS